MKPVKAGLSASSSPTLSGPIRRSISCPRSISSLAAQSPTNETRASLARHSVPAATALVRPSSASLRSHSLSRSGSTHRVPHSSSLGTIHANMVSYKHTHTHTHTHLSLHFLHSHVLHSLSPALSPPPSGANSRLPLPYHIVPDETFQVAKTIILWMALLWMRPSKPVQIAVPLTQCSSVSGLS